MIRTVLDQIGGENALRALIECFYDRIESLPERQNVVALHMDGHGISRTRQEQFDFTSGFMGGRQYYIERHRHMNVRDIHAHVPITEKDAEDWLMIMDRTLAELNHTDAYINWHRATLHRAAMILLNNGVPA